MRAQDHDRVRLLILMTTLLMTGCAVTVDRGLPVATLHERRAEKMFEAGRIAEAMALFQQAAQATPRPFLASIGIARCAIRLGERELVSTAFRVAYGSAPSTPEAKDLLGRTHLEAAKVATGALRMQHATTASSMFSSASRVAPGLPSLAYHAGMSELLAGRSVSAITFLEIALSEDPQSTDTLHALVLALRKLGQRDRVLALLATYERDGLLTPALIKELQWARASGEAGRGEDRRR